MIMIPPLYSPNSLVYNSSSMYSYSTVCPSLLPVQSSLVCCLDYTGGALVGCARQDDGHSRFDTRF